ncbi:MAG: class F sortase [Streptosporangiaceae bacterium]
MAAPRRGKRTQHGESLLLGGPRHDGWPPDRQAPEPRQAPGPRQAPDLRWPPRDLRGHPGPRGRPVRRPRRPGARAATALAGLVLVIGGTFAVFRALSGSAHTLTGGATTVPATVQTTPPRTAADTAAALRASAPVRIIIPSLRVDAAVMRLGRAADGSIQVPPLANHNLAGWYDRSVTPGQDGTSIILGHVDSFTGPSVFYNIKDLTRGELVEVVRADGRTATFSVDGVQEVAKATFPSGMIYGDTRYPGLRLITCGGPFDTAARQYLDNIVVYTHLVG